MRVIIYNINSFGGNHEYAQYLAKAYLNHPEVESCTLLMPANSAAQAPHINPLLKSDDPQSANKLFRKGYYVYRSIINPFLLLRYLVKQPPSLVVFNDFDQLTAFVWAPFFKRMMKKHRLTVLLHDPDRDAFFRYKSISTSSMKSVMRIMSMAFHHGYMPARTYYPATLPSAVVPHGIYTDVVVDSSFLSELQSQVGSYKLVGILGNIRAEKNYEQAIEALIHLPGVKLLIAGRAATSGVSVEYYRKYAADRQLTDRVIFITTYLTQAVFNAAISACDVVLLYYKRSFTSQSGVLNSIAAFHKKVVVADVDSALKQCVQQYSLGLVAEAESVPALVDAIKKLLGTPSGEIEKQWDAYIADASWDRHVAIAINSLKALPA